MAQLHRFKELAKLSEKLQTAPTSFIQLQAASGGFRQAASSSFRQLQTARIFRLTLLVS
jgi:hypothetical protein